MKDKKFRFQNVSQEQSIELSQMITDGIEKANYQGTGSNFFTGQVGVKVNPQMIDMNPAKDNLTRRWREKEIVNNQLAAVYTTMEATTFVSATNPFFLEGGCPPSIQFSTTQDNKLKKHYGVEGGLTLAALKALNGDCGVEGVNGKVMSAVDRQLRKLDIAFRNSQEWAVVNGNTQADANQFDGLAQEITQANGSLVIDLNNTPITKADITQMIQVQALRDVMPTAIVANPLMINFIQELYYNSGNVTSEQLDPWGFVTVPTPSGPVSLVPVPAVGVTQVSGDVYSSDVYILTEEFEGEDLLYMEYLIPETILPNDVFSNGANCTSTTWGVFAVGTLVNRAPVAQGRYRNATFSSKAQFSNQITGLSGNGMIL